MVKKIVFLLVVLCATSFGQNEHKFFVASWNVENLFDIYDDPQKDDNEFLPNSDKQWDSTKYLQKLENLSQIICGMNNNKGPDILGLVEVENKQVLIDLVSVIEKKISKKYEIVHTESLDARGIDNALIFNKELFKFEELKPLRVDLGEGEKDTRYILRVHLNLKGIKKDDELFVYVNHWPSRRGGEDVSEKLRIDAANVLSNDINELNSKKERNVIIVGDFNDEPFNKSINEVLKAKSIDSSEIKDVKLINLAAKLKVQKQGSFMYKQEWNMLDQMIISKKLFNKKGLEYVQDSFQIIKPEVMVTKDGKYKDSPIPTFGGKKYLGGYSDHFPVGGIFIYFSIK